MKRANTATGTTQYLTLSSNSVDCIAVDFDVLQNQVAQRAARSTPHSTLRQQSSAIAGSTTGLPAFMSSAILGSIFSPLFDGIQLGLAQWCRSFHTSLSSQGVALSAIKPNEIARDRNAYRNGISLIKKQSTNQNPEPKPHSRSGGRSRLAAMPT